MSYAPKVYIDLTSDGTPGWVDITSDVLADPGARFEYGVRSNRIDERVANSGNLALTLNNANKTYSPNSTDCRAGFDLGNRIKIVYEGDVLDSDYQIGWVSLIETRGSDVTVYATNYGYDSDLFRANDAYITDIAGYDSNGFKWASDDGYNTDLWRKVATYCTDSSDGYDSNGFTWFYATDYGYDSDDWTSSDTIASYCTDSGYDSNGFTWMYATDNGYDSDGAGTVTAYVLFATDASYDSNGLGTSDYNSDEWATDVGFTTNSLSIILFATDSPDGYGSNGVALATDNGYASNGERRASDYGAQATDYYADTVPTSDTIWYYSSDLPAACGWTSEAWSSDLTVFDASCNYVVSDFGSGYFLTTDYQWGQSFQNTSDTFMMAQAKIYGGLTSPTRSSDYIMTPKLYLHGTGTYGATDANRGALLATGDALYGSNFNTNTQEFTFTFTGSDRYRLVPSTTYIWQFYGNGGGPVTDIPIFLSISSTQKHGGSPFRSDTNYYSSLPGDNCFSVLGYLLLTTTNASELATDYMTDGSLTASDVGASSNATVLLGYATDDIFSSDGEAFATDASYSTSYPSAATDIGYDSDLFRKVATYCTDAGYDSDGFIWQADTDDGYDSDLHRKVNLYCSDAGFGSDGFTWTYATDNSYLSDGKAYATDYSATSDVFDSDGFDWSYATDDGWSSDGTDYGSDHYTTDVILGYYADTDASFIVYQDYLLGDGMYHAQSSDRYPSGITYKYSTNGATSNTALYHGGDFTLSIWFRVSSDETWAYGTDQGQGSDITYAELFDYDVFYDTDELRVNARTVTTDAVNTIRVSVTVGTDTLLAALPISTSTDWFHLAVGVDLGTGIYVYLNGVLLGNSTCVGASSTNTAFVSEVLTLYSQAVPCFLGSLADLSIFNRCITQEEAVNAYHRREFHKDLVYSLTGGAPDYYWPLGKTTSSAVVYEDGVNTSNADEYNKYIGYISSITPSEGIGRERTCAVQAVDWMGKAVRFLIGPVPVQVSTDSGTVVTHILDFSNIYPLDIDIDDGQNTSLTYCIDESAGDTPLIGELNRVVKSEPGYLYVRGGATSDGDPGEVFTFEDRARRQQTLTAKMVLDDDGTSDAMVKLGVVRNIDSLYNKIRVIAHPTEVDASQVVIYKMDTNTIPEIPAGGYLYLYCEYSDSDEAFEVVGATQVAAPVRNTDYKVETAASGGADATTDVRETILGLHATDIIGYWPMFDDATVAIRDETQPVVVAQSTAPPEVSTNAAGSPVTYVSRFVFNYLTGSSRRYGGPME